MVRERWTEYDLTRESDAPLRDADSYGEHPFDDPIAAVGGGQS